MRRAAAGAIAGTLVAVGAPRSGAAVPFTPGQGFAGAQAAAVQFQYGGASLGFSVAAASGQYQDGTATASAATLESGFLTLVSGLQTCGMRGFPPGVLPPTSTVSTNSNENRGPVHASDPGTATLGASDVRAAPNADGDAAVAGAALTIPGLVAVSGGTVHTRATTVPGTRHRTSVADVSEGDVSLLGGVVRLQGLHWRAAVDVTGADSRTDRRVQTPAFDGGTVTVGGVTAPFPKDARGVDALNAVTKPLGVQFRLPTTRSQDGPGVSGATVGPLTLALGGKTLIGPVLHQLAGNLPALEAALKPGVFDPTGCNELGGLLKRAPQLNSSWNLLATGYPILAAALIGSLDGGGEVDLNLGGTEASIDDTYYPASAFGSPVFITTGPAGSGRVAAPPVEGTTPMAADGPTAGTALAPTELAVRRDVRCETTSGAGRPMCWPGRAADGAVAVALLTVGLLSGDEAVRRRRVRRRQEVS